MLKKLEDINHTKITQLFKAQLWEETKGKLNAMVSLTGQFYGQDEDESKRFARIGELVAEFIKDVEEEGLQEY